MAKVADIYFDIEEYGIVETGFNPAYAQVAESVFSLGNEYMGVRGYFEEGYSGNTLTGSYFNGIYEQEVKNTSGYKGIVNKTEFMVNSVNWLYTRMIAGEEQLDLALSSFHDFRREVDFKNGLLTRSFVWDLKAGGSIQVSLERFLSMKQNHMGCQKIILRSTNYTGEVTIVLGADFSEEHRSYNKNYWNCTAKELGNNLYQIEGTTQKTNQQVCSTYHVVAPDAKSVSCRKEAKNIMTDILVELTPGEERVIEKLTANYICRNQEENENYKKEKKNVSRELGDCSYNVLKTENETWWKNVWEHSDIVIDGDELNQQGIRFCIFQLFQTYHGAHPGNNIGAKGLTGEAYNGNAFWDTETYCLPFFIFNNMEAAKNLLLFRYVTLEEAKKRAKDLDCEGAFYPIATISGKECCDLWQHASLQLQASTAVAYGIWFYEKITKDQDFLKQYGAKMLIEICRMLATRGDWSGDHSRFGYFGVMGPDEFQMMVNHNCYTNLMGKFTFMYTEKVLQNMEQQDKPAYEAVLDKNRISREERENWKTLSDAMYIPYDEDTKLFEENEGFFNLPHIDVDAIPVEDFPLYSHWTYDRIYRNDMIKQPDVLMFMLLFSSSFSEEQLRANYDYYEPRCIHESSLSPSVHSILASSLKKPKEAYEFFKFATRMDLDNYNRNSHEGIHTTSIAAAWMNIVYGFGGMRSDGQELSFHPTIPKQWNGYSFRIGYQNDVILVSVDKEQAEFSVLGDEEIKVTIYDQKYSLTKEKRAVKIPKEWL